MAKTIFNSSEKSNFILNMTEEKYSKIASVGLMCACFGVSLFTMIPEITMNRGFYSMSGAGLAISGVICLILALIAIIKKYVRKIMFPVCAFGAMVLWCVVSLINSYDINISLNGYVGRGEGFLAILFYFGFFVTASAIKKEKAFETLVYGITGAGIFNSLWSLIQIFTGSFSHYIYASINTEINAASGLMQSPLFLAMFLTICLVTALLGYALSDSKKKRIFFIICSCLYSFVMIFTYSFIGICGLALSVIMAVTAVIKEKAPKIRLLSVLSVIIPAVLSVLLVNGGIVGNAGNYKLRDGQILWWADGYMRISACGEPDSKVVDITDTYDVYYTLNKKTINIIKDRVLTGTGPDQLVYPQLYTTADLDIETSDISDIVSRNKGTFDRVYNEYLYTAATRGVPSLIALICVLVSVISIGLKKLKKNHSWTKTVFFFASISGILIFLIGCGSIGFSPIFWAVAGALCAESDK
ncbi:MAG: O-antigen ligase family protein [Ruminococcus sp.]|nr:O-antigen ligase family protein [Ruminococcus sp.]